jgi:HD-GYP domain-containing protein (c-di-GMP phosphodiesterase class II)
LIQHATQSLEAGEIQEVDQEEMSGYEFHAIPLAALFSDAILNCQLYLKMPSGRFVKYRHPGFPFNAEVRRRLREYRHTHIYVRDDSGSAVNDYLEENMNQVLVDARIEAPKKAEVLYATTTHLIRDLLSRPESSDELRRSQRLVTTTAELLLSGSEMLGSVIDVISIDYFVYTHSVNVMTYSLALAKRMGVKEGDEMLELGHAALLHDLGKARIDPRIVQKRGPLTPEEFEQMKLHPALGYKALNAHGILAEAVPNAVLNHHEKLNGTGYPAGLTSPDIGLNVRIIACADVYDALTTRRSYKPALPPFDALAIMKKDMHAQFDPDVFQTFVLLMRKRTR